jgi:cytochrome c oxidase subunit 3
VVFWQQLHQQGFIVSINPAVSFFYLLTGLHAAHVSVGILAWLVAVKEAIRSDANNKRTKLRQYIDLCALYWHFLLGLWALLFTLLVSKPDTYNAIVEFCGLGV